MEAVEVISRKVKTHFQDVWSRGDAWDFESCEYELGKYRRQIEMIADRRYRRVLELGCGAGVFTRMLAPYADVMLAVDVAPAAIERAKKGPPLRNVEFRAQDAMLVDLHKTGTWDLIVVSETMCCLGWLYSCFQVGWFVSDLLHATTVGGRCLMANTYNGERKEYLLRPWLIDTYRDLFLRVGFESEREERYHGDKSGVKYTAAISLMRKDKPSVGPDAMVVVSE